MTNDEKCWQREELWWYIKMITKGLDPRSVSTKMVYQHDYGWWWKHEQEK